MNNQDNISKNESISKTFCETIQRRQNQICKVVSCKVKKHMLNNLQQEQMKMMFIEAKWIYNWLLSEHEKSEDFDVFKLSQKDVKDIYHLDKDRNVVNVHLNYIKSSMVDSVIQGMCSSIKTLSTLKKKGHKVGKLNFISEYTSINLKQNGVTHKIVSKNRIKIQGIKKPLPVSGLDQIIGSVPYEIANAKLIGRNGDYYVNLTIFYDAVEYGKYRRKKYDKPYINKQIGRDCGHIHSTIKVWDREFICPKCGVVYDRDVHASGNMVWIYNNLVGVDGTEFKRADFEEQLDYMFNGQIKG